MHPSSKHPQSSQFNDYITANPRQQQKLLSFNDRVMSSKSVYFNKSGFSRKKLTVVSGRDSGESYRGDYFVVEGGGGERERGRKMENALNSAVIVNEGRQNVIKNGMQQHESMNNSRSKNKLNRYHSPSPMTPSKALRLKRSIIKQTSQQSPSSSSTFQPHTINHNLNHRKFQSQQNSPMKPLQQTHSHRRMFSARTDLVSNQRDEFPLGSISVQAVKRELLGMFNIKLMEVRSRMQYQEETIKLLERKLGENCMRMKQNESLIAELQMNWDISKTIGAQKIQNRQQKLVSININETYLAKKINDLQTTCNILLNEQTKTSTTLTTKLSTLQSQLINYHTTKLHSIKSYLSQFIQQKSTTISSLTQSISYLDNKMIGRTQVIRETLSELKQKIREAEDSWTQKDTRETKESTTFCGLREDSEELSLIKPPQQRRMQQRLKQLTTTTNNLQASTKTPISQGSLEFSLTCYQQPETNQNIKNVYYDINQISDISIGLNIENSHKDQISRLTDDFYYPGGFSSRHLSPVLDEKQTRKESVTGSGLKGKQSEHAHISPISPRANLKPQLQEISTQPVTTKISQQTITTKIDCIRQLIDSKKTSSSQETQRNQLRCYMDRTGYLKYTDSKTFVFDKKGNLIPCTEGEFWFLVTKGLIYGKREDDDSRTVSFVECDE